MPALRQHRKHSGSDRKHILTVAMEDYFHAPAFRGLIDKKRWSRFESRYENSCFSALDRLEQTGSSATFFVNCWVAQDRPDLLREVIRRGHEIALSGDGSPSFRKSTREGLREYLRRSRDTVEECCLHRVLGYRRSDVLLDSKDLWALQVLQEEGFVYDSSLSPTLWSFRKEPWRQFIHKEQVGAEFIQEFPLSSQRILKLWLPFAGGNYFRQYPKSLIDWSIRDWNRPGKHPMILYFRLWDLDPAHPRIQTRSWMRNFRHYRNGAGMLNRLNGLLQQFQFESIASYLNYPGQPALTASQITAYPSKTSLAVQLTAPEENEQRTPVSVIVPCYNEQTSIHYLRRSLEELDRELSNTYRLQYILVDDGSRDQTWNCLQNEFKLRPDVLLLRHQQNRGVAAAISTGLQESHEIACSMDCDCSYEPRELKAMLDLLGSDVDMVTASPYHPLGKVSNVPKWRLGLSRGASMLYRIVTGSKLHTFTACFRVYRRSSAASMHLDLPGFLGVAELAGKFILSGRRIVEYPTTLDVRIFGFSKMKVARTVAGHCKLLGSLAWSRMTGRYETEFHRNNHREAQNETALPIRRN